MTLQLIKRSMLNIFEQLGVLRFAQIPRHQAGNHLFVLAYHRVAEENSPLAMRLCDLVTASPRQFNEQMKLLAASFHPVTAEDVLNALNGGKPLPAQSVLVTVDDGYRDFKEMIFPITKKYGIRPVLFLPTAFVANGVFWWDRLFNAIHNTTLQEVDTPLGYFSLKESTMRQSAFDALANYVRMSPFEKAYSDIIQLCDEITPAAQKDIPYVLNWDELRALAIEGVAIASHTHTHPILTHIPLNTAREEVRVSRNLIQQYVGDSLPIFAYPDGRDHAISAELATMLKEEGIQLAFTMSDRLSRLKQDDHQLFPRVVPEPSLSLARFHLRLTALRN